MRTAWRSGDDVVVVNAEEERYSTPLAKARTIDVKVEDAELLTVNELLKRSWMGESFFETLQEVKTRKATSEMVLAEKDAGASVVDADADADADNVKETAEFPELTVLLDKSKKAARRYAMLFAMGVVERSDAVKLGVVLLADFCCCWCC